MTHLDNKKYLESILQGADDDDDLGKMDYNLGDIDVNAILNEVDDFDLPEHPMPQNPPKNNEHVSVLPPNLSKADSKKFEERKLEENKVTQKVNNVVNILFFNNFRKFNPPYRSWKIK